MARKDQPVNIARKFGKFMAASVAVGVAAANKKVSRV